MSQTKEGAKKALATMKRKYGEHYYKSIGAEGGKVKTKKGFATNPEFAREMARKGANKRWNKA